MCTDVVHFPVLFQRIGQPWPRLLTAEADRLHAWRHRYGTRSIRPPSTKCITAATTSRLPISSNQETLTESRWPDVRTTIWQTQQTRKLNQTKSWSRGLNSKYNRVITTTLPFSPFSFLDGWAAPVACSKQPTVCYNLQAGALLSAHQPELNFMDRIG